MAIIAGSTSAAIKRRRTAASCSRRASRMTAIGRLCPRTLFKPPARQVPTIFTSNTNKWRSSMGRSRGMIETKLRDDRFDDFARMGNDGNGNRTFVGLRLFQGLELAVEERRGHEVIGARG